MKILLLIMFLFLLLPSAFSQKLVINEIGFTLKADERKAIEKLAQYEAKLYNGLFDTQINDSLLITLNFYKKLSDYKRIRNEVVGGKIPNLAFYSPKTKRVYIYYQGLSNIGTALHEMSHSFLDNNMENRPKWLNEGLAEFFSSLSVEGNEVQVSTLPHHIKYVKEQMQTGTVNLDEFFKRGNSSWSGKSRQQYMYPVSYSIVHYMISDNPTVMKKVIEMLNKGETMEVIASNVYGGLDRFENRYKFFYKYKY